jgi:predicted phosphate transport protein (TIGR00153 family)
MTTELVYELVSKWPESSGIVGEITRCEQEGDHITRNIVHRLHRSRRSPVDREDLYALAAAIDDIVDDVEEVAQELATYQIEAPMEQAEQLAAVVRDSGRAMRAALDGLQSLEGIEGQLTEIRRLEHEGDRIYREALASLFEGGIDPMLVIRWKDLYAGLEDAIDRCRQAADILQGIIVKHT